METSAALTHEKEFLMGKTAIVIGATGLVGRTLTDQLADADHISRVVTLTRRPAHHSNPKVFNNVVNFERLTDHASLFEADMMFSCLGTTRRQARSIEAQRRVDLDYQYKAAQLAVDQGVHHYLLVSSSRADADSGNAYLKMKGELEKRVQRLPFERISIFQPSLLTGPRPKLRMGEKTLSWILPAICVIPGLHRFRPIRGEQVAAKMVQVSRISGNSLEWFVLDEIFTL